MTLGPHIPPRLFHILAFSFCLPSSILPSVILKLPVLTRVPLISSSPAKTTGFLCCGHLRHLLEQITPLDTPLTTLVANKKYKLVALKVQPVLSTLPSCFHIEWNITGNPLANIPMLPLIPLPFVSHGHYTEERCD